jgi:hypothetical protein
VDAQTYPATARHSRQAEGLDAFRAAPFA